MGQWYEQPEDSQELPLFSEPKKTFAKNALIFAVMWALLAGAILLVAMLAGCVSPPRERWTATFRIEYANGQEITSGHASSDGAGMDGKDSRSQGAGEANTNGDRR